MTNPVLAAFGRPFRLGILGGAPPSMIGPVHRLAAIMDQRFSLVAGVLSNCLERSRTEGMAIGLPEERCYGSVEQLIARESARDDGIEALAIITPNDSHHRSSDPAALSAGLDVMMEKPLCNDLGEAKMLRELVALMGCAVAMTHTFSGYPMLREMRARLLAGEIGAVPPGPGRVSFRRDCHRRRTRTGRRQVLANEAGACRALFWCSAISARMRIIWCVLSPGRILRRCLPTSEHCSRGAKSMTWRRCVFGSPAARADRWR